MRLQDFFNRYHLNHTDSLDPQAAGSVYKATDQQTGETVAVKSVEMHPQFDQGLIQQRFQRAVALQHPYLLPYFAAYRFEEAGTVMNYMVMAYRPLGSLRNAQAQQWPQLQKIVFLQKVLQAVQYLHQQGLVWQQLSAGHLLLAKKAEEQWIPQCSNYGAKERIPIAFFRRYEYCAPEQFDPQQLQPDPRTDIWSFGVLCYWLFTGQYAFGQQSGRINRRQVQSRIEAAERPGRLEELPELLQPIVEKCLQKNVEERWASVEQLLEVWPSETIQTTATEERSKPVSNYALEEEEEPEADGFWARRSKYRQEPKPYSAWLWWLLFLASCGLLAYLLW